MKTFIRAFIVPCMGLMLFLTACNKNQRVDSAPEVSINEPANPSNPYDSFGYWHNTILDYVQNTRSTSRALKYDPSYGSIREFYRWKSWSELRAHHFDRIPQIVNDAATDVFEFIDRSKWGDSVKAQLRDLLEEMQFLAFDSCTYPQLKQIISDFENEVLNSSLPNTDKEVILKIASLARFSGYRWINQKNSDHPFNRESLLEVHRLRGININELVSRDTAIAKFGLFERVGKWFAVTATDIGGAISDLSVASGAAASDYMSAIIDLH